MKPVHAFVLSAGWLLPSVLAAHELDASVVLSAPTVIVRASYGGTEPVPFANVQVFSPASHSQEFQTGRADKRGYFSFVPESSGNWRVVLDDEEGHRREINVTIPEPFRSVATAETTRVSRLERTLLGLALIVGFTGFFYGFKARRPT